MPAIRLGPLNANLGPVNVFSAEEQVAELGSASLSNASFDVAAKNLGIEAIEQMEAADAWPDMVLGCAGGGSSSSQTW